MNWREKRRAELEGLGSSDAAMLVIRYYEIALEDGVPQPPDATSSPATMIEAILNHEEAFGHPPISHAGYSVPGDTALSSSSQ